MLISEQKKLLRKQIRMKKQSLNPEEKRERSAKIIARIEQSEVFQSARIVMVYWSLDDEVQTHDFISKWHTKKIILLPVLQEEKIVIKQFKGIQFLERGKHFGIQEPLGGEYQNAKSIDLVIVPGVAFDKSGNRLGRGKAFYDHFLKDISAFKIGICYNIQLISAVPVDENDICMDEVFFA